jgi:SH3-like domain-containing protein
MRAQRRLVLVALLALAGVAQAVDFRSIGPSAAVMYDAPGTKARKMYVAPLGMPVEIVVVSGDWSRVRDAAGELTWVENKSLTDKRMLVVDAVQAQVRRSPADSAPLAFTVNRGVLLELAGPIASGWIKVRHRDGDIGFLKAEEVWGE